MYPNGHEVVYPVCMCGSACLSVLDAACRAPPSSAHGRGCCEHSVTSPGGRPSPGADHGGQGWGLEEARGQAQSSLQGHILQKNQPSSEWASGHGEHNSALGSSGSSGWVSLAFNFPIYKMAIPLPVLPSQETNNELTHESTDAVSDSAVTEPSPGWGTRSPWLLSAHLDTGDQVKGGSRRGWKRCAGKLWGHIPKWGGIEKSSVGLKLKNSQGRKGWPGKKGGSWGRGGNSGGREGWERG